MKGKVLFFDTETNRGIIEDKNKNQYTFHIGEWLGEEPIIEGKEVSFDIPKEEALNIRVRKKNLGVVMKIGVLSILIILILLVINGCTTTKVSKYGAVYSNVQKLKKIHTKISVNHFTAKESKNSVSCMSSISIETPNRETFEKYIENALIEELKMANVYSENADIVLSGNLKYIGMSTAIGQSYWKFVIEISSSNGKSFTVTSKKEFESSFIVDNVCENVKESFRPAIEQLITKIITNDKFKELIK